MHKATQQLRIITPTGATIDVDEWRVTSLSPCRGFFSDAQLVLFTLATVRYTPYDKVFGQVEYALSDVRVEPAP